MQEKSISRCKLKGKPAFSATTMAFINCRAELRTLVDSTCDYVVKMGRKGRESVRRKEVEGRVRRMLLLANIYTRRLDWRTR